MDNWQRIIKLMLYIAPMILTIVFHRNMRKNRERIGSGTEELFSVAFDVLTFILVGVTVLDLDVTGWFLSLLQQHFRGFLIVTFVIAMLNPVLRIRDLLREDREEKLRFWIRESVSYNLLGWIAGAALSAFVLFLTASGTVDSHFLGEELDNDFLTVILYCAISVPFFFYVDDLSKRRVSDPSESGPARAEEDAEAPRPLQAVRTWWESEARWKTANALWLACIALIAVMNVLFIFKTRPVFSDGWYYTVMILCCDLFFLRLTHSSESSDNDRTMQTVFLAFLGVEAVYLLAALRISGLCRDICAALGIVAVLAAVCAAVLLHSVKGRTAGPEPESLLKSGRRESTDNTDIAQKEGLRVQAMVPYLVPAAVILSYIILRWVSL